MESMAMEVDEILNEAIMTNTPKLIVEGISDVAIYSRITEKIPFDVELQPVEQISGFGPGAENVIAAIEEIDSFKSSKYNLSQYVLGLVDKDVSDYRGEDRSHDLVLVSKYYSIESHFISLVSIGCIVKKCTYVDINRVHNGLNEYLMPQLEAELMQLYYYSLESLKSSVDSEYDSCVSYSDRAARIVNDSNIKSAIKLKKMSLDRFAEKLGLLPDLNSLKMIAKGHWLVYQYSSALMSILHRLSDDCRFSNIDQCSYCTKGMYSQCLYRVNTGHTRETVLSLLKECMDESEVRYIYNRICKMKPSNTYSN